jgi:hypothetical protein
MEASTTWANSYYGSELPETLGYVAKIPPETIRTDYPGRLREYR